MLLIIFMHILYGCIFTISKMLVKLASPIFVIGIRMLFASILLLGISVFLTHKKHTLDRLSVFYILQISIIGIYLPYILRYWALQYLPVTKVAILYNLSPFAAYFFSYFFFKEKPTSRKWLGLTIGLLGALPVLIAQATPSEQELGGLGFLSLPEIAMIASIICLSYGWIIMKQLVLHNPISSTRINGINMFIGGTLALGTSFLIEPIHTVSQPSKFFLLLALIIIVSNLICYNLYSALLKKHSATLISLGGLITPVSAAITSYFYFGEKITWDSYLSGGIVVIGFLIFYSDQFKKISQTDDELEENNNSLGA